MEKKFEIDIIDANLKTPQSYAADAQSSKAFNKITKIGVFKELHKKGLLSDGELTALIAKQNEGYSD